jgi:hypothetical protein
MAGGEHRRSLELELVRDLLFAHVSPEEGWRRIDAALDGAADAQRFARIERLAEAPDLDEELLRTVRSLRDDELALDLPG